MLRTLNTSYNHLSKSNKNKAQFNKVFECFYNEPQSMKMVSVKLNIDRANVCWYCRELRKNNQIDIVKKAICSVTKQMVNYYTTNPELFKISNQLRLF